MELNDVPTLFAAQQFPTTSIRLAETLAEETIHHPDGSERLADVLVRCGPETFHCPEDAVAAVYAGVSAAAVGRIGYSDRDPTPIGTSGPEPVSF